MVKRISALLLVLSLLLCFALACDKQQGKAPEQPDEGEQQKTGVTIDEEYVIVFPQGYDLYIDRAVSMLVTSLMKKTGVELKITNERSEVQDKEIVVGVCNRFDAASVTAPLSLQGEKVILYAKDAAEIYCIARTFVDNCIAAGATDADGRLCLDAQALSDVAAMGSAYDTGVRVLTQNLRYANDKDGNSVAERSERFVALVDEYAPDIIGTQEATPLWTQYLNEHFSNKYGMVGVFRDGVGTGGDEANYILYRKDRFTVEESGTFWLTETPEEISRVDKALCNRICTWALLRDTRSGKQLLACNTHLDHSTDTVRSQQLQALFDYLAIDMKYTPVVFTGDFNMLRDSEPYEAVIDFGLKDGQRNAWIDDSEVDYSCHLYQNDGEIIDYCFYSKEWSPIYAKIISDDYGGYVSDHYGVIVDFIAFD